MNEENNTIPKMENTNQIPGAPQIPSMTPTQETLSAPPIQNTEPTPVINPTQVQSEPIQTAPNVDTNLPTIDEVLVTQNTQVQTPVNNIEQVQPQQTFIQTNQVTPNMNNQPQQQTPTMQPQNKPTPSVDPNSDIYVRGPVEKVKKGSGGRTFVLLAILVVCIIVFWPRINMALVNAGLIKENNNTGQTENNNQNNQNTNTNDVPTIEGGTVTTTPPEDSKLPTNKPDENTQTKPTDKEETTKPETNTQTKPSTPTQSTTPSTPSTTTTSWNGVYTKGSTTLKIYKISDDEIAYITTGDSFTNGNAEISGNKAVNESFGDTTTFTLSAGKIELTSNDDFMDPGTYTKKSDYTKNDYYEDTIGDIKYATTKINGIFKKDNVTIKIFQTKSDEGRILITKGYSTYSKPFDIVNGKIHLEDDFFDEIEKIDAEINGSTLTITASDTDPDGLLNEISGTYTKSSTYSIDEILKDNA